MTGKTIDRMDTYFFVMFLLFSVSGVSGHFEWEIHHLSSDSMKSIISPDTLPERGSYDYYATLAYSDRVRSRKYQKTKNLKPITFLNGNLTTSTYINQLQYVNISLGEPIKSYILALDTGSNLFWIECALDEFAGGFYNPTQSLTSVKIPCGSPLCMTQKHCGYEDNTCDYEVKYLDNTSSSGVLFQEKLHLISDESSLQHLDATIIIGCGLVQPKTNKISGLIGLGMDDISIPSLLAKENMIANSFSMCFSPDQTGRIKFGDKGIIGQNETPFRKHPRAYTVDFQVGYYEVSAVFDSGTAFTYLPDPAYGFIVETFKLHARLKGLPSVSIPYFEHCYEFGPFENNTSDFPPLYFIMKSGSIFKVHSPMMRMQFTGGDNIYCLGIFKSSELNIIGHNSMIGYHITFDRERMILGWSESNCYNDTQNLILSLSTQLIYQGSTSLLAHLFLYFFVIVIPNICF